MNRRDALGSTTALFAALMMSPSFMEAATILDKKSPGGVILNKKQVALLDQIADTMLPTTPDSPGAKAAGSGPVMARIIKNCYTPEDGKLMVGLLEELNSQSVKQFKTDFVNLSAEKKLNVLTPYDTKKEAQYVKLKELVVFVYFTSEIGMNQALRYIEVPGSYDGCLDYKKEDKAWAWAFLTY